MYSRKQICVLNSAVSKHCNQCNRGDCNLCVVPSSSHALNMEATGILVTIEVTIPYLEQVHLNKVLKTACLRKVCVR